MGRFSMRLMTMPPSRNSTRYISKTAMAFFTVSSAIRRPKNRPFSRLRKTATVQASSTAMVVVFMPPAVEPGLPPMSMSPMVMVWPVSLRAVRSAVLKPAVLGVTDWNADSRIRLPMGSAENSKKKKYSAGTRSKTPVEARITLLCIRYRRMWKPFSRMSCQVRKPMPPMTIRNMMVMFTTAWSA